MWTCKTKEAGSAKSMKNPCTRNVDVHVHEEADRLVMGRPCG